MASIWPITVIFFSSKSFARTHTHNHLLTPEPATSYTPLHSFPTYPLIYNMLCSTEQIPAPAAHPQPSPSAPHVTLLHDPRDPSLQSEYEALVLSWARQLVSNSSQVQSDTKSSSTATTDTTSRTELVYRHLDALWIDAQYMLQCAQAWNARPTALQPAEAIHTVNILGLHLLQRVLDTRRALEPHHQELQQPQQHKQNDFGNDDAWTLASNVAKKVAVVQDAPQQGVRDTTSRYFEDEQPLEEVSQDDEDDEEEQVMHAPLLRRHQDACSSSPDVSMVWTQDKLKKKPSLQTIESVAAKAGAALSIRSNSTSRRRPLRLVPSPSAPCCSITPAHAPADAPCHGFQPAVNYQHYYHCSAHHEASQSSSLSSSTGSLHNEDHYWRSWFGKKNDHNSTSSTCAFCKQPVAKKSLSASDATEAAIHSSGSSGSASSSSSSSQSCNDQRSRRHMYGVYHQSGEGSQEDGLDESSRALLEDRKEEMLSDDDVDDDESDGAYDELMRNYGCLTSSSSSGMIRSESSISAFRPISKNLAPRCAPPPVLEEPSSPTSESPARRSLIKSRSFPSKVASIAVEEVSTRSPPPPSLKERNFVMRSLVNKKVSLSKLFNGKRSI